MTSNISISEVKNDTLAGSVSPPLDYFYTSRTSTNSVTSRFPKCHDVRHRKPRFPEDDRWHTLAFREYARECLDAGFSFTGVDWLGDIMIAKGKFLPRWSRDYIRRSIARVYKFAEACAVVDGAEIDDFGHIGVPAAHFVTLSVRHAVTGSYRSMKKTVEDLRSAWSGVARWVNRKGWHYLRIMEPGSLNHYPHYHMVIVGATTEDIEKFKVKWIQSCERRGITASLKAQDSQEVTDIHNVGAYVTKYMSKSFGEDEEDKDSDWWWRWMELCYRERIRVYAMDSLTSRYIQRCYPRRPAGIGFTEFVFASFVSSLDDLDDDIEEPTVDNEEVPPQNEEPSGVDECLMPRHESRPNLITGDRGRSPPKKTGG